MSYVKMDTIVDQIISVPLDNDGKKEPAGGKFDWDGVTPAIPRTLLLFFITLKPRVE